MMQTYLSSRSQNIERRVRQQMSGKNYLYFYTEKRIADDGTRWVTERPISEKEYVAYLMDGDTSLHTVRKTKHRFAYGDKRLDIDVYPFSHDKAILFVNGASAGTPVLPAEIKVIREITDDPDYKNRRLAQVQSL